MQEAKYYAENILNAADKFLDKKFQSKLQSIIDKNEFNEYTLENISQDVRCFFEQWLNTKHEIFENKSVIDIFEYFNSIGRVNELNSQIAECFISSDSLEHAEYKPFKVMAELMSRYGFNWDAYLRHKINELILQLNQVVSSYNSKEYTDIEDDAVNFDEDDSYKENIFCLSKIFIMCKVLKLKELCPDIIEACININEHSYYDDMPGFEARSSLLEIGEEYTDILFEKLRNLTHFNPVCEQLILCLAELGSNKKNEQLYKFLKEFFKKHEDKVFASDCLVRYNDSRAIVVLRGYIERNLSSLDKNSFYELKSAVDKLGGQTSDIVDLYLSQF